MTQRLTFFLLALLIGLATRPVLGQRLYRVKNFSDKYYGKVWLAKPSEVFSPGWVAVYDKATNKLLLKVSSDELAAGATGGEVKAGVHELPYGEQSVIQYADFNFDGIKDFALEDGQNSCYHGPSFRVYLAQGAGFVLSEEFTQLAQEYCGLFEVDKLHKRLATMTKDGCCWHQFNEYVVRGNVPVAVKVVEEDARHLPYVATETKLWNGKAMVSRTSTTLDLTSEGIQTVLSFKLANSGKRVVLFSDGENLSYALLKATSGEVEFNYPTADEESQVTSFGGFSLRLAGPIKTLEFRNGSVLYRLYEKPASTGEGSIGVEVVTKDKTVDLGGSTISQKGSLTPLAKLKLANVKAQ